MRYFLGGLTLLASGVLFGVGAFMNWEFGVGLGTDENSKIIYGVASVAADILKFLAPFGLVFWLARKRWGFAAVSFLLFIVCAGYSWTSSLGFASKNRGLVTVKQEVAADKFKAKRDELRQINKSLKNFQKHRPEGVIKFLLAKEAIKTVYVGKARKSLAEATNNCTTTSKVARRYCDPWLDLKKEAGLAAEHASLKSRQNALNAELAAVPAVAANPQASFMASISGLKVEHIEIGLTLLVALLVEAGSSIGYFLAAGFILSGPGAAESRDKVAHVAKAANLNVKPYASTIASSVSVKAKTEEDKLAFDVWLNRYVKVGQGSKKIASSVLCKKFNSMMSRDMQPNAFGRLMKQACGVENTFSEPSGTFYNVQLVGDLKHAA